MVSSFVEGQKKYKILNFFQLCTVIFPTMIAKVQIINVYRYTE